MNLLGLMVVRNEADRYLAASVAWLNEIVDELLVFDDQSTDDSAEVARENDAIVKFRPLGCPSFLENESLFRQEAWMTLGKLSNPTEDDWVLCVDADEFVVSHTDASAQASVRAAIELAESEGADCIDFPVAEVFDMVGPRPMVRTDGEWDKIRAARLCRWHNPPVFAHATLAGGSLPMRAGPPLRVNDPVLLHAGYRRLEDRHAKHRRYTEHHGHGGAHVDSILKVGIYEPWSSPLPKEIAEALQC